MNEYRDVEATRKHAHAQCVENRLMYEYLEVNKLKDDKLVDIENRKQELMELRLKERELLEEN